MSRCLHIVDHRVGDFTSFINLQPLVTSLDQTPTPSKFLRAFEEAGLDEALQNPFEATFKAAVDRVRNYYFYFKLKRK